MTDRERYILDFIREFQNRTGRSPTNREISDELGMFITKVRECLDKFLEEGIISYIYKPLLSDTIVREIEVK